MFRTVHNLLRKILLIKLTTEIANTRPVAIRIIVNSDAETQVRNAAYPAIHAGHFGSIARTSPDNVAADNGRAIQVAR